MVSRKAVTISAVSRDLRHNAVYSARDVAAIDTEAPSPLASHDAVINVIYVCIEPE